MEEGKKDCYEVNLLFDESQTLAAHRLSCFNPPVLNDGRRLVSLQSRWIRSCIFFFFQFWEKKNSGLKHELMMIRFH